MSPEFQKTKPSFLEAGLPCASLSAECQRDNNARQRPPQNRLHIWWARRPPTISRAAVLAALLPHDLQLEESLLPSLLPEPQRSELDELPGKLQPHRKFFERLLDEVGATELAPSHSNFLRALGVQGDSDRAYRRMAAREHYPVGGKPILLPMSWTYRHPPAFKQTPASELVERLLSESRQLLRLESGEDVVVLDFMAGGGVIPLEALRYGAKVYANDLNPVASLVLKATTEYPARFGTRLRELVERYAGDIQSRVRERLEPFFYLEPPDVWWQDEKERAERTFRGRTIVRHAPANRDSTTNCTLWCRLVTCSGCSLEIPISTNFHLVNKKGQPDKAIAAFPEVPSRESGNRCTFRIVSRSEFQDCRWPAQSGVVEWHPRNTPTFKDGKALCPRCGHVTESDEVKAQGQSLEGGLPAQIYAVVSKVPVKLTYANGETRIRTLWRFRPPAGPDLEAEAAAVRELERLLPRWEAHGLVPDEAIPEETEDKRPRDYGMTQWRDFFLPRQLLTNLVILEEILAAQERVRQDLPEAEAEAVSVYLAFLLSKVVNYNSVNTFWDYTRNKAAQTFSRHDFAFRPAFCEMEGSRDTVSWGASQVLDAYEALCALIHGGEANLESGGDEEGDEEVEEEQDLVEEEDDGEAEDAGGQRSRANAELRPEVLVPTVTNQDAAALSEPGPGSVHLICVDPPYYDNVQYSELSNFFYVWLKRALAGWPGLAHLFTEPLAETNREAVANRARWQREAEQELAAWDQGYQAAVERHYSETIPGAAGRPKRRYTKAQARELALQDAGPKPATAKERADAFYQDKMTAVFRRARRLLHPAGRMVVMFNHKQTWAWRALGMALIRAGFEVRSSIPVHTEAESSLNIRGLDAARSTVLLLCMPREEHDQAPGNWGSVQARVARTAQAAASLFQAQGLRGTDLYLSALGPALGEVGRQWPVTDFAGRPIDLEEALEVAYRSVGQWRLSQLFSDLTESAEFHDAASAFSAEAVDRDTQTLWLWLDTFQGETADSDDVRKLAKALGVDPDDFRSMGLLSREKALFLLRAPQETDLSLVSRRLHGEDVSRGRAAREGDAWEERTFPNFLGAAVWNAVGLIVGTADGARGIDALRRWLRESGYGSQGEFLGAYAVTLTLLESVFADRAEGDTWGEAARGARRGWDLVLKDWRP